MPWNTYETASAAIARRTWRRRLLTLRRRSPFRTREALPRERLRRRTTSPCFAANTSARTCFLWRASRNSWAMPRTFAPVGATKPMQDVGCGRRLDARRTQGWCLRNCNRPARRRHPVSPGELCRRCTPRRSPAFSPNSTRQIVEGPKPSGAYRVTFVLAPATAVAESEFLCRFEGRRDVVRMVLRTKE